MNKFIPKRIIKKHTVKLNASAEKIFPLLCPAMEYKWIQFWDCEIIFSDSGCAEDNCVFKTYFPGDIEPETWIVSRYEPNSQIQFVRFNNSLAIRYNITLIDTISGADALFEQIFTSLNHKGNDFINSLNDKLYLEEITALGDMLNHYIATGKMLEH